MRWSSLDATEITHAQILEIPALDARIRRERAAEVLIGRRREANLGADTLGEALDLGARRVSGSARPAVVEVAKLVRGLPRAAITRDGLAGSDVPREPERMLE